MICIMYVLPIKSREQNTPEAYQLTEAYQPPQHQFLYEFHVSAM